MSREAELATMPKFAAVPTASSPSKFAAVPIASSPSSKQPRFDIWLKSLKNINQQTRQPNCGYAKG